MNRGQLWQMWLDWLPKFWWDFFSRALRNIKIAAKKKMSLNKNYKERAIAAPQTENFQKLS
jgi:hypothetical protein